jgi:hypothetical protein
VATTYDVTVRSRAGHELTHTYTADDALAPGDVIRFWGRDWLVEDVDDGAARAVAKPARYRLVLRHPDGREEAGAVRRFRPDTPRVGHGFTTVEDGGPASWQVVAEGLARDDEGEPYLEFAAERDYGEVEEGTPADHQLEHALARDERSALPAAAAAALVRAEQAGQSVELVALEPGEEPDWEEAARFVDALVIEEIEDDLLEQCGVNPSRDSRDTWLDTVKQRLRADLEAFRDDVEGDHDEIEEWDFRDGRIFAAVGRFEDEADPDSGYGWLTRLFDAGVLAAAGFERVRKASIVA